MKAGRRWGWALVAGATAGLLAGCAATEPPPLLPDELARLRADLSRIEQSIQRTQGEIKADLQRADRQSAQALTELQRSVAQLGSRLDEVGRDTAQIQGRLDDLRRRLDTLALQLDVAGAPPSSPGAGRPATPSTPAPPAGTPPPSPSPSSGPPPSGAPPSGAPAAAGGRQAADLYQTAYIDYTRGNYNLAVAAFREFIRLYPDSELADKAQYWVGESHFSLGRDLQSRGDKTRATQEFERAVQEFRKVLINYPRGDRVPTAVYKEALALLEVQQPQLAEARLQFLVDQFPYTEEAAKAKEELTKLRRR